MKLDPARFNLSVYRGDTYSWRFVLWQDRARTIPVDLDGITPKAEIRDRPGGAVMVDLPLDIELPNIIVAKLSADDGKKLTRNGVWDLQLTINAASVVATVIAGHVFVRAQVTDS
jgi:hypothetical protein